MSYLKNVASAVALGLAVAGCNSTYEYKSNAAQRIGSAAHTSNQDLGSRRVSFNKAGKFDFSGTELFDGYIVTVAHGPGMQARKDIHCSKHDNDRTLGKHLEDYVVVGTNGQRRKLDTSFYAIRNDTLVVRIEGEPIYEPLQRLRVRSPSVKTRITIATPNQNGDGSFNGGSTELRRGQVESKPETVYVYNGKIHKNVPVENSVKTSVKGREGHSGSTVRDQNNDYVGTVSMRYYGSKKLAISPGGDLAQLLNECQ